MTGWTLLNPLGLVTFVSLAVVGLIYFFYKRHKQRVISGLFLFERQAVWQQSGRRLARLRTSRSLILDILACLLLCAAFAGPTYLSDFKGNVVLVLDSSLSMRTADNHLKVRERALALVSEHGTTGHVTLIEAGRHPKVTAAVGTTMEAYRRAVRNYDPFAPKDSLFDAIPLAKESTTGSVTIHIFTDRRLTLKKRSDARIVMHILKGALPNLAFVDAQRQRERGRHEEHVILAVTNFAASRTRAKLVMTAGQARLAETPLDLGPEKTFRGTFALLENTGPVTVTIEAPREQDRLAEDSHVLLMPPPDRSVTYRIAPTVRDTRYLTRALEAAGAKSASGDTPPHLLITDSTMAEGSVTTLELAIGEKNKEDGFVGPFVVDRAHALCLDVDLLGVYWVPARLRPVDTPLVALISVGEHPLYYQTDSDRLHLNLDLAASNITRSPAWPVMIAAIVDQTQKRRPGLSRVNYVGGDALRFNAAKADGHSRRLKGEHLDIPWPSPRTPPRLPEKPGKYDLIEDGMQRASLAVNAIAPRESNLMALATTNELETIGAANPQADGTDQTSVAWILVLAALLLFALNWFLTGREVGNDL